MCFGGRRLWQEPILVIQMGMCPDRAGFRWDLTRASGGSGEDLGRCRVRGRGRRDHVVHMRLDAEEHAWFSQLCIERDITISAGLRRLVREAAAFGPSLEGESQTLVKETIAHLRAVGVNLNQVVRAMNTGLVPDSARVRESVDQAVEQIHALRPMFVSICAPRFDRARRVLDGEEASPRPPAGGFDTEPAAP